MERRAVRGAMRAALVLLAFLALVGPTSALPPTAEPVLREFGGCEARGSFFCEFVAEIPPSVREVCLGDACTPGAFPWAMNHEIDLLTVIEIHMASNAHSYHFQCIVELAVTSCGSSNVPQQPLGGLPALSIGAGTYDVQAFARYSDTTDWDLSIVGFVTSG